MGAAARALLAGCLVSDVEPDDLEHVAALETRLLVEDASGRHERIDTLLGRARLRTEKSAAGARRDGRAMNQEGQNGEPRVGAFGC